jgi:outer membrane lipoprotein carrier protein
MNNTRSTPASLTRKAAYGLTLSALVLVASTSEARAQAQSAPTTAASATAAYERAATAYASQQTIDAQFDQKITNALLGKTVLSHGRFVQQKPHLVSIEFTQPDGDHIVDDGKSLWVFLPSSSPGQVLKLPSNSDGALIVDMLGQFLNAPKQSFTIGGGEAVLIDGAPTRKVSLVPRVANTVPFVKATLWIDDKDARLRQIQVTDDQGVDRTITIKTWSTNAPLDKNLFKFSVPKGVKVVTKLP